MPCAVFIGDANTGKTSLIHFFIFGRMYDKGHDAMPECVFHSKNPKIENLTLLDTVSDDLAAVKQSLTNACAICLCFALDDSRSIDSIKTKWLPLAETTNCTAALILAGTKMDRVPPDALQETKDTHIHQMLDDHTRIEAYITCNARSGLNVQNLFWLIAKSIHSPRAPLYNPALKTLTPEILKALKQIFNTLSTDNDTLNTHALATFLTKTFNSKTAQSDRSAILRFLNKHDDDSLYYADFVCIFTTLVQKGRADLCWRVLRKYRYDDALLLKFPVFDTAIFRKGRPQLSSACIQFLSAFFEKHARDQNAGMSLHAVFACTPGIAYFIPESFHACMPNTLGLIDFLCMCQTLLFFDGAKFIHLMHYLGFDFAGSAPIDVFAWAGCGVYKGDVVFICILGSDDVSKYRLLKHLALNCGDDVHSADSVVISGGRIVVAHRAMYAVYCLVPRACTDAFLATKSLTTACDVAIFVVNSDYKVSFDFLSLYSKKKVIQQCAVLVLCSDVKNSAVDARIVVDKRMYSASAHEVMQFDLGAESFCVDDVVAKLTELYLNARKKSTFGLFAKIAFSFAALVCIAGCFYAKRRLGRMLL